MTFKEVQELIKLINKSNLTEFKMKDGDFNISIRTKKYGRSKGASQTPPSILPVQTTVPSVQAPHFVAPVQPQQQPASQATPAADVPSKKEVPQEDNVDNSNLIEIRSLMVGTFYRSSSPDKPPYVKVGDVIEKGSVVCIVEAMKLFNEIESEIAGKIVKVVANDASPVEYDQVLFLVEPL